jgi:hypothetical protein
MWNILKGIEVQAQQAAKTALKLLKVALLLFLTIAQERI